MSRRSDNREAAREARRQRVRVEAARLLKPLAGLPPTPEVVAGMGQIRKAARLARKLRRTLQVNDRKILATGTSKDIAELKANPFDPALFLAVEMDPRTTAV